MLEKSLVIINRIELVCFGIQRKTLTLLTVVNKDITTAFFTSLLYLYFYIELMAEITLALVSLFMTLLLFLLVAVIFPILLTMRNKLDKNISTVTC